MDPLELVTRLPVRALKRCRIPEDVRDVTVRAEETPGRELALSQGRIESVWDAIEALYRTGVHPALQVCIRYRGQIVLHRAIGHASGNAPEEPPEVPKVQADTTTPFCIFSASKAITAMVIHKLDEQHLVHLEDPVCEYIPEFASHGKHRITLRHVLSHRAGIPNLPPEAIDLDLLGQPERVVEILCEARPRTRPGRLLAYHAITGGFVLGEVVRRVTGMDIRTVLGKEILEPLGIHGLRYGVDPEDVPRVAVNALTGPPVPRPLAALLRRALGTSLEHVVELSNDRRFLTGIVPAGNSICTAEEASRFFQCMLDGGEFGGVRVFDPRTVKRATSEQNYLEADLTLGIPIRYGLGLMLGGQVGPLGVDNPEAFGHLGLSNVIAWADPKRHLSGALLNNGKPILSAHVVRFGQVLLELSRAFPKD